MAVEYGVSFDGSEATGDVLDTAKQVIAAGGRSLWMAEHMGYREAMVTSMGFRLNDPGAFVVPTAVSPYLWHPTPTAMSLATLAEIGTAPVGIAVGVGNPLFLAESGKQLVKPVRAVREFIECLRNLWTGEGVQYEGEFFNLAGARLGFRPPQPLVIYVAAIGDQMLSLAGRIGDGVALSAGLSPAYCRASLALAEDGAAKADRDLSTFRKAAYVILAISEDGKSAINAARYKLAFLLRNRALQPNIAMTGIPVDQEQIIEAISRRDIDAAARLVSDDAIEAFSVAGTPRSCRDRLEPYIAAGVNELVLMVLGGASERQLTLQFLSDQMEQSDSGSPAPERQTRDRGLD